MKEIEFWAPSGETLKNPSMEVLREIIFERGKEFWERDSFDAGLYYRAPDANSQLILMRKEPYGFCVQYIGQEEDEYALASDEEPNEVVTVYPGGESLKLPRNYFVSPADAWTAIEEFCQSGKRQTGLRWIVFDPPEPERTKGTDDFEAK
jgi:hypothetical protein